MRKMIVEAWVAAKMGLDFLAQQNLIAPVLAQDQIPENLSEHDKQVALPGAVEQSQSTSLTVIPEEPKIRPVANPRYIGNAEQTRNKKPKLSYLEYSEKLPQLGYKDEMGNFISAIFSSEVIQCRPITNTKPKKAAPITDAQYSEQQLSSELVDDPVMEVIKKTAEIIPPIFNDARYAGATVYDMSYSHIRSLADTYLNDQKSVSNISTKKILMQQLAFIDKIEQRLELSPTKKITYNDNDLKQLTSVFLDGDNILKIAGNKEEQEQLRQLIQLMLENKIGFERVAAMAIMHTMHPARYPQVAVEITRGDSQAPVDGKSVHINMYDVGAHAKKKQPLVPANKRSVAGVLSHELSHSFHFATNGGVHRDLITNKQLMEAALADSAIAHIYAIFPPLRDMEKLLTIAPNYTPDERKKNIETIKEYIAGLEASNCGQLFANIDPQKLNKQSDRALAEILFKSLFIGQYIGGVGTSTISMWTDAEEMLTIGKDLPLLIKDGRRVVIRDEQSENAFLAIEGIDERYSHHSKDEDEIAHHEQNRQILSLLEDYQGSAVEHTLCNHIELTVTDEKVKILLAAIKHGDAANLRCIDLTGASKDSDFSIATGRELFLVAEKRNIILGLPRAMAAQIREEVRQAEQIVQEVLTTGCLTYEEAKKPFVINYINELGTTELKQAAEKYHQIKQTMDEILTKSQLKLAQITTPAIMEQLTNLNSTELNQIKRLVLDKDLLNSSKEAQTLIALLESGKLLNIAYLDIVSDKVGYRVAGVILSAIKTGKLPNLIQIEGPLPGAEEIYPYLHERHERMVEDALLAGQLTYEILNQPAITSHVYSYGNMRPSLEQINHISLVYMPLTNLNAATLTLLAAIHHGDLRNVTTLDLTDSVLEDDIGSDLALAIENGELPNLTQVNITNTRISPEIASRIQTFVHNQASDIANRYWLHYQDIHNPLVINYITKSNSHELRHIQNLSLWGATLTNEDSSAQILVQLINSQKLSNVKILDFTNSALGDGISLALATAIETGKLPNLTQIKMINAKMSAEAANRIAIVVDKQAVNKMLTLTAGGELTERELPFKFRRDLDELIPLITSGKFTDVKTISIKKSYVSDNFVLTLVAAIKTGKLSNLTEVYLTAVPAKFKQQIETALVDQMINFDH